MKFLKRWSLHRFPWFLVFFIGAGTNAYAYIIQTYFHEMPCYYCVIDRFYLYIVALGGIIGMINPRNLFLRLVACLAFVYGSLMGTYYSYLHLNLIAKFKQNPFTLDSCPLVFDHFYGLPQKYFPNIFTPIGNCNAGGPSYMGLNLVEWTAVLFVTLAVIAILVLVSQVRSIQPKRLTTTKPFSMR
ncbi:disulfide bond formation protein B [Psittacicella hinzii]|uniref:Disulfide bond formation protein B n=1 Tax=Psittacicella hinzii TaxID=2028575 RepID=A0A3A1YSN2_9GAMM|nr:disulfide bond formation protein B [Psittacicella hinzii]RIY40635.1 hypothetical protein CKF58_00220 [Psittacicella hinzii]